MMQESKGERAIGKGVFIIRANSITHMTLSHWYRLEEEIEYFDLSFMHSALATHAMHTKLVC